MKNHQGVAFTKRKRLQNGVRGGDATLMTRLSLATAGLLSKCRLRSKSTYSNTRYRRFSAWSTSRSLRRAQSATLRPVPGETVLPPGGGSASQPGRKVTQQQQMSH